MAKKGNFNFKDIVGLTDGLIKKTAILRETEKSSAERGTISTGIYVLNAALSSDIYGGISDNRITVFGGESGVGKSFLCYNICKQAQSEGYSVIYIDTEFSIELDQLPGYGIDISEDKFMLIRSNVIEDLKILTTQLLDSLKEQKNAGNEIDKFIIVLDSVGQLGSRKEIEDAKSGKEKADMTKAKALASYFRIINSDLGYLQIPMIATNHTYKCVTGDTKVRMSDNSLKEIKDINSNDFIMTLMGPKKVNFNTKYDNASIYEIVMEDGIIIRCTPDHKFLITDDWSEDETNECWKEAQDLLETDYITCIDSMYIKLKSIRKLEVKDTVYDINVEDVHHYILENGMVTHNTMDLFPKDVMKGGCLTGEHIIQTRTGLKQIQDIIKGDYVMTLNDWEEVLETHIYEKEVIELLLDNGQSIKCSKEHKFLINIQYTDEKSWKIADEINDGDMILFLKNKNIEYVKVIFKTELNFTQTVHDLTIANSHHYIDENGIIHHNSGLFYSASAISFLSKAKLKDGNEDDLDIGQSGIVVTAKMIKNRMAKPKKVKFEISFVSGCNPFIGLDYWCTADNFNTVGIAKGKMVNDTFVPGGNRWYVKHLGTHVATASLFSDKVFIKDVLDALRPIIKDYFEYKSITEIDEINKRLENTKGQISEKELFSDDISSSQFFDNEDED